MEDEYTALLLGWVLMIICVIIVLALLWYYFARCRLLEEENRAFRQFIELQYHMDADYMTACCAMFAEYIAATQEKGQKQAIVNNRTHI